MSGWTLEELKDFLRSNDPIPRAALDAKRKVVAKRLFLENPDWSVDQVTDYCVTHEGEYFTESGSLSMLFWTLCDIVREHDPGIMESN